MILEIADIRIHPGQNAAFEEAIQRGLATVASRAKGFQGSSSELCRGNALHQDLFLLRANA